MWLDKLHLNFGDVIMVPYAGQASQNINLLMGWSSNSNTICREHGYHALGFESKLRKNSNLIVFFRTFLLF
jgi:hypothetical protein